MSRTFRLLVMALIAALALGIAACGDDDDDDGGGGGASTEEQQGADIKAGVVTDIGGLNDRGVQRGSPTTAASAPRTSSASRRGC